MKNADKNFNLYRDGSVGTFLGIVNLFNTFQFGRELKIYYVSFIFMFVRKYSHFPYPWSGFVQCASTLSLEI